MQPEKFELRESDLAEMAHNATRIPIAQDGMSYERIQQCITIQSLIDLLLSYKIEVPFTLEGYLENVRTKKNPRT